jgi:hypothetical protein
MVDECFEVKLICRLFSSVDLKIDCHGGVVRHAETVFSVDNRARTLALGCVVEEPVIDPPSPIQRTSLPAIRPPGVRTVAFTCLITHRVVPSALQQVGEPGAFMGEKTTRLLVALPVEDVPFGGGDVEISCQADRFGFLAPWFSPRGELSQHLVFDFLSSL